MKIKFKLASQSINISISKAERETNSNIFVNEWKHDACVCKNVSRVKFYRARCNLSFNKKQ